MDTRDRKKFLDLKNLEDRKIKEIEHSSNRRKILQGFERKLDTGHSDDIQFDLSREYLFGVSIFSLYGRPHDPNSPNLYGRGRISGPLLLSFE